MTDDELILQTQEEKETKRKEGPGKQLWYSLHPAQHYQ